MQKQPNAAKNIVIILADFITGGREFKTGDRYVPVDNPDRNRGGWQSITNSERAFECSIPKHLCVIVSQYDLVVAKKLKELGVV